MTFISKAKIFNVSQTQNTKEKGRRAGERKGENSSELGNAKLKTYEHTKNWTSQGLALGTIAMDLLWSSDAPTPMQYSSLQAVCCPETQDRLRAPGAVCSLIDLVKACVKEKVIVETY